MEFERVVPPSGNMQVVGRQFWLGPHRAGLTITFWAGTEVIHLMTSGSRVKSVRSHLAPTDLARLAADGARPARPRPATWKCAKNMVMHKFTHAGIDISMIGSGSDGTTPGLVAS